MTESPRTIKWQVSVRIKINDETSPQLRPALAKKLKKAGIELTKANEPAKKSIVDAAEAAKQLASVLLYLANHMEQNPTARRQLGQMYIEIERKPASRKVNYSSGKAPTEQSNSQLQIRA